MEPIVERPRSEGEADERRPEAGLVDLVDQALVRLDGLRDRPRLSSAVTALLVFLLAVGWGLTRWRSVEPIDDRIPDVDEMVVADGSDAVSGPAERAARGGEPSDSGTASPAMADPTASRDGSEDTAGSNEPEVGLVVHVSGAVVTEGLVELADGSRLADAISAAGGATPAADVHRLNLATPLVDGMHIRVPEVGEEGAPATLPLIETADPSGGPSGGAANGSSGTDADPVNVNQAGVAELQRLPGIGPAIAAAIVAWRDDHGPFTSIDGLLDVPGIGPAKLSAIEDQVIL